MTKDPGEQQPAERLLDLALYAPVGLALSALEAIPELIRKGRARLGPQVGTARTIGQFAVRQGYRQFVGFATSQRGFPFGPLSRPRRIPSSPASHPKATAMVPLTDTPDRFSRRRSSMNDPETQVLT